LSSPASDRPRAVTFDLGGTLIRATPSVGSIYARVCADHGIEIDPAECNRAFEAAWGRRTGLPGGRDRFSGSPGGEDGWWRRIVVEVLEACGVDASRAPEVSFFRTAFAAPSAWRIFEDVPATLRSLRSQGLRLAILSNWDSTMQRLMDSLDLTGHFDVLICSAIEGVEKPERPIFERASARLGIPPEEILHVGDLVREDYEGARTAGMRALWIDRRRDGGVDPPAGVEPGDLIRSIAEVPERLTLATRPRRPVELT
jgi:putative hydrolase of the HAD superfamily